jgi:opacity protein-like surface antigen
MSLRKISIALASVVVLAAAPAFAQGVATVQDNTQTNIVTGKNNRATNNSNQVSGTSQRNGRGDAGTSQRNDQLNDVEGKGNNATNNNNQVSGTSQRSGRGVR